MQIATCRAESGEITTALSELSAVLSVQRSALTEDSEVFDLRRHIGLLLGSSGALPEPVDAAKLHTNMVRLLDTEHAEVLAAYSHSAQAADLRLFHTVVSASPV